MTEHTPAEVRPGGGEVNCQANKTNENTDFIEQIREAQQKSNTQTHTAQTLSLSLSRRRSYSLDAFIAFNTTQRFGLHAQFKCHFFVFLDATQALFVAHGEQMASEGIVELRATIQ
jgi:hypothetical protein